MKYYYIDPLAAAWMARSFGMRFIIYGNRPSEPKVVVDPIEILSLCQLKCRGKIHIHPDSLSLLHPKVGDLVGAGSSLDKLDTFNIVKDDSVDFCRELVFKHDPRYSFNPRIIERNNIHFMWPEIENV